MTKLIRLAAALAIGLYATVAFAAGGTSSNTSPTPTVKPSTTVSTQKQSKTAVSKRKKKAKSETAATGDSVKKKRKKTKPVAEPSVQTVDLWAGKYGNLGPAYIAAIDLAKNEKYQDALAAFKSLNKPEDPRVLNWIGFSLRKVGKVDEVMPFYEKALGIAPEYTPAYEYLGEAYVQLKNVDKAKEQLARIEQLCGNKTCEEYTDLNELIAKAAL